MPQRNAHATWKGTLKEGNGLMEFDHYSGPYTYLSRFEEGEGTNPEELAGAAIAGCFSMFLAAKIGEAGFHPKEVTTNAKVKLESDEIGPLITSIKLESKVFCDGMNYDLFNKLVEQSKKNCPISRLYQGGTANIDVFAELIA